MRKLVSWFSPKRRQAHAVEHGRCPHSRFRSGCSIASRKKADVLLHGQIRIKGEPLRDIPGDAANADGARALLQCTRRDPEQGGFATSVAAEQSVDLTRHDSKVQIAQYPLRAV